MNKSTSTFTARYATLHGLYQASYALVIGYASVFLLSRGYTDAMIGVILAVSNAVAAVFQPVAGSLLDKKKHISLQVFSACLLFIMLILAVILMLTRMSQLPMSILVIIIFSLEFSVQPLVNSLCFLLEHAGISINFGLCRGIGSMTFAILSAVLGKIISVFDESLLPVFYIAFFAALGIVFLSMRIKPGTERFPEKTDSSKTCDTTAGTPLSLLAFVCTYKRYMLFLVGSALVFVMVFAAGNFYVFQIVSAIGGGATEMGIAMGFAAALELPIMALFNKMNRKCPVYMLLRIAGIVFVIKFLLILLAKSVPMFYFAQIFQMGSYAIYYPAAAAYTSRVLPPADLVKGQSLLTCMFTISGIIASLIGGLLINYISVSAMLLIFFVFSVAGAVIIWFSMEKIH